MHAHRIDVHHHILPPNYVRLVGDERIGPLLVAGKTPVWTPQHSIEAMDRNGIEKSITSISAPGLWLGDTESTRRLTRECNDYAAKMRQDHPGRFGLFASLPLPDVEGSLREIAYALDELKADGIGLLTNYDGKYPGDVTFAPVFEELNRRKAVVYFHPTEAPCCAAHGVGVPAATLDFPFDTTKAITSMLFAGTFARCRDVRFIFSHAGGTVPFLAERIARLQVRPEFKASVPDGVMFELKRLFFDTALSANELAFSALLTLVAPEQVLFGSDYPFAPETTMTATVKGLTELGLPAEVLRAIERTNALKLFARQEAS
ncbi:MAG TPA: amidohydrolase family protein [Bradyrhizobium sp.]|nr:amidohydrolase family protein [Bradyrhizobium sp.]